MKSIWDSIIAKDCWVPH